MCIPVPAGGVCPGHVDDALLVPVARRPAGPCDAGSGCAGDGIGPVVDARVVRLERFLQVGNEAPAGCRTCFGQSQFDRTAPGRHELVDGLTVLAGSGPCHENVQLVSRGTRDRNGINAHRVQNWRQGAIRIVHADSHSSQLRRESTCRRGKDRGRETVLVARLVLEEELPDHVDRCCTIDFRDLEYGFERFDHLTGLHRKGTLCLPEDLAVRQFHPQTHRVHLPEILVEQARRLRHLPAGLERAEVIGVKETHRTHVLFKDVIAGIGLEHGQGRVPDVDR